MKSFGLLLALLSLIFAAGSTLAQDVTATPDTPTPTPLPVTLRVFPDRETLTIMIVSPSPLLVSGLEFRVSDQGGVRVERLDEAFDILLLTNGYADPGACFVYRLDGSSALIPDDCANPQKIFLRAVTRADVFWFNPTLSRPNDLLIAGPGTPNITGEQCPFSLPDCNVVWFIEPTPTPTPTETPTPGPTNTPTPTPPDGTLPVLALSARCDGNNALFFVSNQGASLLHSIRWNGYIGGVYNQGGVIQPINSGVQNFFFFRFVSTDGYETRIELEAADGILFENGGTVFITCPPPVGSSAPTAAGTQGAKGYPCEGMIVSPRGATTLNIIRKTPNFNAPTVVSVQRDEPVTILEKQVQSEQAIWYRIADRENNELGWLTSEYVLLSSNCPG